MLFSPWVKGARQLLMAADTIPQRVVEYSWVQPNSEQTYCEHFLLFRLDLLRVTGISRQLVIARVVIQINLKWGKFVHTSLLDCILHHISEIGNKKQQSYDCHWSFYRLLKTIKSKHDKGERSNDYLWLDKSMKLQKNVMESSNIVSNAEQNFETENWG